MNNRPSDEELFEKGLSEILSNEPQPHLKSSEQKTPANITPPATDKPIKRSTSFMETIIRIAALLITIIFLILFALQISSR
ncbi:MAG: hypothetical protein GX640_20780 [Fibrobacter sp.]|nr:hypothetical protein [Fibrobacter sp.]